MAVMLTLLTYCATIFAYTKLNIIVPFMQLEEDKRSGFML